MALKIAENIKHGESLYRNAKRYGIAETTIKGWIQPEQLRKFKLVVEIKEKTSAEKKMDLAWSTWRAIKKVFFR